MIIAAIAGPKTPSGKKANPSSDGKSRPIPQIDQEIMKVRIKII